MDGTNASKIGSDAERRIMKDLLDALLAERLFAPEKFAKLSDEPALASELYPFYDGLYSVYVGPVAFLAENGIRQGRQWADGTPVYRKDGGAWTRIADPVEVAELVLRSALDDEAFAHPGVAEFLESLRIAVRQLGLSLEHALPKLGESKPSTSYEWHLKAERIAALRDRPFHPASKAKIGFDDADYGKYAPEFGEPVAMRWVAIAAHAVVKGCPESAVEPLDVLTQEERKPIERELANRGISKERYAIVPVHPWQLERRIVPDFGKELAEETIVVLDTPAGAFVPTSSLRSFATLRESVYSQVQTDHIRVMLRA